MKYSSFFIPIFIFACNSSAPNPDENEDSAAQPVEFYGNTQGTTYALICNDSIELTMPEVTQILANFDDALSSYIDTTILSELNNSGAGEFAYSDPYNYFNRCYQMSQDVYRVTNGSFDPTVYPLVDGWGFMKDVEIVPDSVTVDSLRALLGFNNGYHFSFKTTVSENGDTLPASTIIKNTPQAKLDFNAIAQGLAVDVLAEEIEKRGGQNYFVEIGGEIRVNGVNSEGRVWQIGIDQPIENSDANNRQNQEIIRLNNRSVATSGSYRKFYEKNGIKYSHTLDPETGYPVTHSMLSATVVTKSCAMADAMATAFMVMGQEKAIAFVKNHPELNLEVYFIFINEHDEYETYYTPTFGKMILL